MENQKPEALALARIFEVRLEMFGKHLNNPPASRAAKELRRLHARVQELEAFAKEVEQYGVLLRAGGAAPHDLKDLSAALAQCVELAKGVLK